MLRDQSGMALLLTLAIISFLVALTVQLNVSVTWQLQAADRMQKTTQLKQTVFSGLNIARAALYADQEENEYDSLYDAWNLIDANRDANLFTDEQVTVTVADLSGRIQVNALVLSEEEKSRRRKEKVKGKTDGNEADGEKLQRQLWLRFLGSGKFAVENEEEALALVDALSDWIDADDQVRDHGAESGYYQTLDPPYVCRNAPLQYPEELLLIKGFSQNIVYGDQEHVGLLDYVTVHGDDGVININSAPLPVLSTLAPGLQEEDVEALLEFRNVEDNKQYLAHEDWYRQVTTFPGDITLNESVIGVTSSFFSVRITAERESLHQQAVALVFRDPQTREQRLLSWKIE